MNSQRAVPSAARRDLGVLTRWCAGLTTEIHLEVHCVECPPLPGPPDRQVVRLTGCLADADAGDLAELAAVSGSVVLRVDGCARAVAGPPARRVAAILAALGSADRLQVWTRVPDGMATVPGRGQHDVRTLPAPRRRALFSWALPTDSAATATERQPDRPEGRRLVDALRTLQAGAPLGAEVHELPSEALDLHSSGCTACGACVKACPTDVLALRETAHKGGRVLTLDQAGCIGCTDCVTLCPVDALSSTGPIGWGRLLEGPDEVVLEEMETRTCRRCRTRFAGGPLGRDLCPVCADRRADPFGSRLPPGYVAPTRPRGRTGT